MGKWFVVFTICTHLKTFSSDVRRASGATQWIKLSSGGCLDAWSVQRQTIFNIQNIIRQSLGDGSEWHSPEEGELQSDLLLSRRVFTKVFTIHSFPLAVAWPRQSLMKGDRKEHNVSHQCSASRRWLEPLGSKHLSRMDGHQTPPVRILRPCYHELQRMRCHELSCGRLRRRRFQFWYSGTPSKRHPQPLWYSSIHTTHGATL